MTTINPHTTRANGTVLTATIYNADHTNHISNATALNAEKIEGATPPVVDGHGVVFDGTGGAAIASLGRVPGDMFNADNLAGLADDAASFNNIKQAATNAATGVIEHATDAEVRSAAAGNLAILPSHIESASAFVALTDGATVNVDWDAGINFTWTIGGNRTLANPTNGQPGTWRMLILTQDGTGSRAITWGSNYRFTSGADPILSTAAGAIDIFAIFCQTASLFHVFHTGKGMAT